MAGYTAFSVGLVNNRVVYIPIPLLVASSPRVMDPKGRTWERVCVILTVIVLFFLLFPFLFLMPPSLSVSLLPIYCSLFAFSDTMTSLTITPPPSINPSIHQSINQPINYYYLTGTGHDQTAQHQAYHGFRCCERPHSVLKLKLKLKRRRGRRKERVEISC
jgi:hypothetical protein